MNPPSPDCMTPQEFAALISRYTELLETDPDVRERYIKLCGSLERAWVFASPRGVGISRFAEMMSLPATTLRHYLRLDLVAPYRVNGKFRFHTHNIVQVESVRQWCELGMTLEEILELRQVANMALSVVRPELEPGQRVTTVRGISGEEYAKLESALGPNFELKSFTAEQMKQAGLDLGELPNTQLLAEYKALREKLEARRAKIEAQLARVAQLEAALSESKQ